MISVPLVIQQTQKWIQEVVVKNNFCPFAAAELAKNSIHYEVVSCATAKEALEQLSSEWQRLDKESSIATSFLIFPDSFNDFFAYLDFLSLAQSLLTKKNYEGIYQLASFHPTYRFADAEEKDPANYTNRSPYPMLHILREADMEKALQSFLNPERIPERNIALARKLGLEKMKVALQKCQKKE